MNNDDDELMCLLAFGAVVASYVFCDMWSAVNDVGTFLRGLLQ